MEDDVSGNSPRWHFLGSLVPLTVFSLIAGLLSASPAVAHTFTKADGNDSRGRLDLRSVSVSHTATGVVHRFQTYESWTARSLGADSFFIVQIDKNNNQRYERCAFIYFASRLRGSLTNCGATFIRSLPVTKLSATAARITIPKSQTGSVYWWAGASLWDGPAPCGNGCVDFAPNNFPDILHDMLPPVVTMVTDPLRVWQDSTTPDFTFPFSLLDANSGMKSWSVQARPVGGASWTTVASGTGGGTKSPDLIGVEGTRTDYRVVAKDRQGNRTVGPARRVYIPTDDDPDLASGFSPAAASPVLDPTAFGGSYTQLVSGTFTYTWTPNPADCLFELIGPGTGTWNVTVMPSTGSPTTIDNSQFTAAPRQTLYSNDDCTATSYVITWNSGTFSLDAVLG
jgi:hypothetical protein